MIGALWRWWHRKVHEREMAWLTAHFGGDLDDAEDSDNDY